MNWRCLLGRRWRSRILLGRTDHTILEFCTRCSKTRMFAGQCTVFYDMDTGRRCGSFTESRLSDLVSMEQIRLRGEVKP